MMGGLYLPKFREIAERHPGLKMILDHCGLNRHGRDAEATGRTICQWFHGFSLGCGSGTVVRHRRELDTVVQGFPSMLGRGRTVFTATATDPRGNTLAFAAPLS